MVRIEMDGMCKDCEHADLDLVYIELINGEKMWDIKCNYHYACEKMKEKMEEKMEVEHDGI